MKLHKIIPAIISILVLGFLIHQLTYAKSGTGSISYTELIPIIGVLVAIIAIIIGLLSVLGYFLLDKLLEERIDKLLLRKSTEWFNEVNIINTIGQGYIYYTLRKLDPNMLDMAIDETNKALRFYPNEYFEYFVKNNLAFYYALRDRDEEDAEKAKEYSELVFDKSGEYFITHTSDAIEWRMTRAYVMAKLAKTDKDLGQKEESRKIYQGLLKTQGISLDQANRIKEHMKSFWAT